MLWLLLLAALWLEVLPEVVGVALPVAVLWPGCVGAGVAAVALRGSGSGVGCLLIGVGLGVGWACGFGRAAGRGSGRGSGRMAAGVAAGGAAAAAGCGAACIGVGVSSCTVSGCGACTGCGRVAFRLASRATWPSRTAAMMPASRQAGVMRGEDRVRVLMGQDGGSALCYQPGALGHHGKRQVQTPDHGNKSHFVWDEEL